ncbi:multifunctional 2',3'-cyclic-nucleotide 2'-phosphodiesterase/5'-nucleotidase/3'-nucleotidase [Rhodobacteraceae bacterium]|nr:multifunctional 2',3'-cyclic-nucleotide 2'-phosphodiesterase/5'-nucleotidase/3'-nucleotidase [Paracoccaceae bacterium]
MRSQFLLASVAVLGLSAGAAQAEFTLNVLHTNDFHARFEPISKYDSTCASEENTAGECFGGTARLVSAVKKARAEAQNSILVDGGDQFQGSLFYTYYKGKMAAEFMNKLGYDAMTVGNHEFDDGPETLRAFMDTVKFPVLMSNADVSDEPQLADVLKKSTVLTVGGQKIGLIGLTPEDTGELSSPGKQISFSDPAQAVQAQVDKLTEAGVNKIIVLSHSGYVVDKRVAANTSGVDVIVGGHDNTLLGDMEGAKGPYPTMVGDTAIVQAYAYGKFLGDLRVTFDDQGVITSATGQPLIMDAQVDEDTATVARIGELAKPLDEIRNKVVAEAAAPIDGGRDTCRAQECEMGDLLTDAMLDRMKDQGIDIALTNGGGLRASIDAGPVTMGEVFTVLPFQNTLATFDTTGQVVIDALENGASQIEEQAGRFSQVAGLKYTVDPSAEAGARISDVMVRDGDDWVAIDPDANYGVATNNYLRGGGDGYQMFEAVAENVYDYGPDLAEVLADYLMEHSPYQPETDGRITVK